MGIPGDTKDSAKILKLAAYNSAVHLYLGAADAFVLPHLAQPAAGTLEIALLALSYGRSILAPRLPRFKGILPSAASIFYAAGNRESLLQALLKIQARTYALNAGE